MLTMTHRKPYRPRKRGLPTKLATMREARDLSIADAAKKLGVSARTWTAWEHGVRNPSKSAMQLLKIVWPELK